MSSKVATRRQDTMHDASSMHHPVSRARQEQVADAAREQASREREEMSRGRRRSRDDFDDEIGEHVDGSSENGEEGAGGPSRKRRRSRKGLDKKFDCPHEGCGKSYSRAEHLYRHQLNHNPKQIYNCDFPDCRRYFVRQDLCARHKERHTARGSQLQRKDAFLNNINTTPSGRPGLATANDSSPFSGSPTLQNFPGSESAVVRPDSSSPETVGNTMSPVSTNTSHTLTASVGSSGSRGAASRLLSSHATSNGSFSATRPQRSDSNTSFTRTDSATGFGSSVTPPIGYGDTSQQHLNFSSGESPVGMTPSLQSLSLASPYTSAPTSAQHGSGQRHYDARMSAGSNVGGAQAGYLAQQNLNTFPLSSSEYASLSQANAIRSSEDGLPVSSPGGMSIAEQVSRMPGSVALTMGQDQSMFEQVPAPYTYPVFGDGGFGEEAYSRSPFVMADNFAAWLFSEQQQMQSATSGSRQAGLGSMNVFADGLGGGLFQPTYLGNEMTMSGLNPPPMPPQHPMAVTSLLDTSAPESLLSDEKRQELIEMIINRFNEDGHAPVNRQKEALLRGDRDDDSHVLSLQMMRTYIVSFWYHFHPQLPILHKPTFAADKTPSLLLLAIIAIGASCLDKVHGHELTQACAELSKFLAWHLRWPIFSDADARPPAKLWIFQALLLLEVYEKMYSTRALHERAHIHHASTIALMRRGSSLIGRSPLSTPPSLRDEKPSQGVNGALLSSATNTPEKWWQRWIKSEETRRAAFAAFVIDSIHATMFGHSAIMVAHEIRLPLPCDEALWSANNSAEVGRIEASLLAKGIKPATFLEGLKSTLSGKKVQTNSFGRTILMAGLLSVSYHMHQRDLQVHFLGVSQTLGGRDKWRASLLKAFDEWQHDFDGSLGGRAQSGGGSYDRSKEMDEDVVFESRTVLHHLAHMAMHVDIVDCQILAGASRLLGRVIGAQDYRGAQIRMQAWAPKAQARDATFYSLRFLSEVFLRKNNDWSSAQLMDYTARDDSLLNRPWVLYFAALIVWSYGYTLEGALPKGTTPLSTSAQKHQDTRAFLERLGRLNSPEDLSKVQGRNGCAGMLLVLADTFRDTRWELLHEASNLLDNCVNKLYDPA